MVISKLVKENLYVCIHIYVVEEHHPEQAGVDLAVEEAELRVLAVLQAPLDRLLALWQHGQPVHHRLRQLPQGLLVPGRLVRLACIRRQVLFLFVLGAVRQA